MSIDRAKWFDADTHAGNDAQRRLAMLTMTDDEIRDAPPEARLRARVAALLARIADEASCEFAIICTELANPTGLLHEAMRDTIRPLRENPSH